MSESFVHLARAQTHCKPHPLLHAVSSGGMYGIERTLATLLSALHRTGVPVALLCLAERDSAGGTVGRSLELEGVPVFYVPLRRGLHPRDLLTLRRLFGKLSPRALHVHGYKATFAAGIVARLCRIPIIATIHSEVASAEPGLLRVIAIENKILNRIRHVVAVSKGVAADLDRRGVHSSQVTVIRNGIDDPVDAFRREARKVTSARAVVVGRLVESKNVHVAIEAIAQLQARGIHASLEIIGDGPERVALRQLAIDRMVASRVEFVGFVEDVHKRLQAADMFLMPSRSEGIPIALLEAMASGVPIIASGVGGIPEVVCHDREALLVEPDRPEQLSAAIARLVGNPSLAQDLAVAARKRFEREFQSGTMRRAHQELYDRLKV